MHCDTLQHTALQHTVTRLRNALRSFSTCARHCNTLQHTALQHTVTGLTKALRSSSSPPPRLRFLLCLRVTPVLPKQVHQIYTYRYSYEYGSMCIYTHEYIYIYVYTFMFTYKYICICIHIYTSPHSHHIELIQQHYRGHTRPAKRAYQTHIYICICTYIQVYTNISTKVHIYE